MSTTTTTTFPTTPNTSSSTPATSPSTSTSIRVPMTVPTGAPTEVTALSVNQGQLLPILGWVLQSPSYDPGAKSNIYITSTSFNDLGAITSSASQIISKSSLSSQSNVQPSGVQLTSNTSSFKTRSSGDGTASPTSSRVLTSKSGGNLPDGAVAGIAVGVALFASFITLLIAVFIMRSRRSRSYDEHSHRNDNKGGAMLPKTTHDPQKENRPTDFETTKSSRTATWSSALESHLPPSEDDYTIQNDIHGVLEQIAIHADNYYDSSTSTTTMQAREELRNFTSLDSPPLMELLSGPSNPILVIQHCLTRQVLQRISPNGDIETTFLPVEFVALPSTLERLKSQNFTKPGTFGEAFSHWRVLSAYLFGSPTSNRAYLTSRDHRIDAFVRSVSQAFSPWAKPGKDRTQRVRHLTAIIRNAAEKGILLFSQPSTFEFDWGMCYDSRKRQLVVSPALIKVANRNAQKLQKPQNMISHNVASI